MFWLVNLVSWLVNLVSRLVNLVSCWISVVSHSLSVVMTFTLVIYWSKLLLVQMLIHFWALYISSPLISRSNIWSVDPTILSVDPTFDWLMILLLICWTRMGSLDLLLSKLLICLFFLICWMSMHDIWSFDQTFDLLL